MQAKNGGKTPKANQEHPEALPHDNELQGEAGRTPSCSGTGGNAAPGPVGTPQEASEPPTP